MMNYLLGVPTLLVSHSNLVNAGLEDSPLLQTELDYIKEKTSKYVPTPEELASCSQMFQQFSSPPSSNSIVKKVEGNLECLPLFKICQ